MEIGKFLWDQAARRQPPFQTGLDWKYQSWCAQVEASLEATEELVAEVKYQDCLNAQDDRDVDGVLISEKQRLDPLSGL